MRPDIASKPAIRKHLFYSITCVQVNSRDCLSFYLSLNPQESTRQALMAVGVSIPNVSIFRKYKSL